MMRIVRDPRRRKEVLISLAKYGVTPEFAHELLAHIIGNCPRLK